MSLMMIETTADLPDEGEIYNKDYRYVIVFILNTFYTMDCRVLLIKIGPNMESIRKTS